MMIEHSPPVLTRVAIACKPSCSSHVSKSCKVSVSICSSLSISTNPQFGFSLRTIAVETLSCSLPLMLSHRCPLYVSSPFSTDKPGKGSDAFFSRSIFFCRTSFSFAVMVSYSARCASASSSAFSLLRFVRTFSLMTSMSRIFCSSSAVDSSCRSSALFSAHSRSRSVFASC